MMTQIPSPEDFLLKWRGDILKVTLRLDSPRKGHAAFRTNIGHARVRRREIIAETERGETPLAKAWTDIPLAETSPGVFEADIPLDEVGVFSGKACFFPEGSKVPEWPEGRNTHIKVESAETRKANSIYTVFPRQFGSFREVARRLDFIMGDMGFRIIQTLPPFPVPTTYAVMGEYGCPFAATDFLSVDPAMAEFDEYATPLDQFRELIDAVHAREGLFFVDLPANHTGWASTLQTHHPDWFHREGDGHFVSPGAWGVKWADLVELDYSNSELRAYMADVFLFWCRNGVDGFRCDAGYMIPVKTWEYIVARVREEYPDTVFMLEGLGGELAVTDTLLAEANLDWAYSEIFQTYDRGQFEWYLPGAIARSEKYGTLVHFAETHDNDRLAKGGETYAKMRVALAALLSWQGAWGIANGVEWFCTEKIDVHGKNDLNWGAARNMVPLIAKLNYLLRNCPAFEGESRLKLVTKGAGNTLAVLRNELLVLVNLDCARSSTIDFERGGFAAERGYDLISQRFFDVTRPIELNPGEVLCLHPVPSAERERAIAGGAVPWDAAGRTHVSDFVRRASLFHLVFPRDARRTIVVPEEQWVEVRAEHRFRMRIIDPANGRTLRVYRSRVLEDKGKPVFAVRFDAPHYKGDGTACRKLEFFMIIYAPGRAQRLRTAFLVPPSSRAVKVLSEVDGAFVRRNGNARTILSNGAGAAAQIRLGWGRIASQYDSLLAANPNPDVPSDRLDLWARTRCWLQREGYLREFDEKCVTRFTADPAGRFASWDFVVPCGMGKETAFTFTVALAGGENAARVEVVRREHAENDVGDQVRIVFRPDLEWRSHHATTKAFAGLENLFPRACAVRGETGVSFAPYEGEFRLETTGGVYHHEPQWTYNISHPEEAERGQEGSGDLFSPGWISADLRVGERVSIVGEYLRKGGSAAEKRWPAPTAEKRSFAGHLRRALDLFIVKRDALKTVIAGYPWFLDWGRDTFIFMRGMIAAGKLAEALEILKAFAAFEENGTLPNIISGKVAQNRDTTDAQLWFIRASSELLAAAKAAETPVSAVDEALLVKTANSIVDHYLAGTPNGIKVDPDSALVWSPSHFTWMDTNYPACTPREGYPVEIQALWVSALEFLGRGDLAAKARASIIRYFRGEGGFADCLVASRGVSAANALADWSVRPNQLFLVTLGVSDDKAIVRSAEELLVPGGMRSLDPSSPLYRGVYTGDEDTSRKRAYHNGTVWTWVFPLYAEALVLTRMCSKEVALQLLASAVENLNAGCLGHMSENADGDSPHAQKGCTAQAWGDSELLRVWLKLGGK